MRLVCRLASIVSSLSGVIAAPAFADVALEGESFSFSDTLDIASILDGIEGGSFERGENSFTHNEVALTVRRGGFEASLLTRYDYVAEYTEDTGELIYEVNNDVPIVAGQYDLSIELNEAWTSGIRVGYRHELIDGVGVSARISGLFGHQITDGSFEGVGDAVVDEGLGLSGDLDYFYTNPLLFDPDSDAPSGVGYAVDLGIDWKINDRVELDVQVRDLFAEIFWSDAARTVADVDTQTFEFDDDGLLIVRPTISGQFSNEDHTQRLQTRVHADAEIELTERWRAGQTLFAARDDMLSETRLAYKAFKEFEVSAHAEWRTGALGLGLRWHGLELQIASDEFDPSEAKYLRASAVLRVEF
ncbi:MAG: DUF5723 family protein [Pseudomonadota bacterium]